MLAAIGMLPVLLAGLAQTRRHDEWLTRPETVQRLAKAAAEAPRTPQFELPMRRQIAGLRAYLEWKLGLDDEPVPVGFMPAEVETVNPNVAAAVNAGTDDAARALLAQLEAISESGARLMLRRLRDEGAQLLQQYGASLGWRTGEPPIGLVQPPPPPPLPSEAEEDWAAISAATAPTPPSPGNPR
ncbi:hypothetical protein [Azospirillum sp. B510]|uniref:hypothetical protein n=1 Tax=Azospirillum sp. (strain B510) TaxID=137722 RepID=UPI0011D1750D|nr:hypothetical protein [Azospirillum sp. B510]